MRDGIREFKSSNSGQNLRFYHNLEMLHESSINGEQLWSCGIIEMKNRQDGSVRKLEGDNYFLRDFYGEITPLDNASEAARWAARNGNSDIASYIAGD